MRVSPLPPSGPVRLASERSRTPREQPLTHYSARQYDHDFPPFTNAIGAPPSTHKGKGKGKLSDRPPLHVPGKNKGKGKFTPKGSEKGSEKGSRPRLRERIRQRFWKRSRQGQRQRQKRKGPHHCNGITPLRMAAAPPYRCTRLPSLQRYIPTHAYYTLATGSSTI